MSKAGAALLLPGSLQQIQAELSRRLAQHSDTPGLEAQVLLAQVLGQPRAWIVAHPEAQLDPLQAEILASLGQRRLSGEPLPYLLGKWEFFSLEFIVTPAVLIPRPETELLVERALAWLATAHRKPNQHLRIADIGTGSGCIAVSLALHAPVHNIIAVDISQAALEVARNNVHHHQVEAHVQIVQGDLLAPFASQAFDLICANLPYIPTPALAGLSVFGREPTLALDGGPDGLGLIRILLAQARQTLAPGGLLLLEIEAGQGQAACGLASRAFPEAAVSLQQDLAGNDRLLAVQN